MVPLSQLILATLAYSDIFDYPLTEKEVQYWLIRNPGWEIGNIGHLSKKPYSQIAITKELKVLKKQKIIGQVAGYYFLANRQQIVPIRLARQEASLKKLIIAQKAGKLLGKIRWITMVGITGSLAMNNCMDDDDIDLLIVTKANRLWLTRPLAVILLKLSGIKIRRFSDSDVKNKLCLNVFMEEGDLLVKEQNLYIAHEIRQIILLFQKDNTYFYLLNSNRWSNNFFVHFPSPVDPGNTRLHANYTRNRAQVVYYINILIYYLNELFYILQKKYMRLKMTNETISLHQAYFHPTKLSPTIKNRFLTRLANLTRIAIGRVE